MPHSACNSIIGCQLSKYCLLSGMTIFSSLKWKCTKNVLEKKAVNGLLIVENTQTHATEEFSEKGNVQFKTTFSLRNVQAYWNQWISQMWPHATSHCQVDVLFLGCPKTDENCLTAYIDQDVQQAMTFINNKNCSY